MSTLLKLRAPIPEALVHLSDGDSFAVRGLSPVQIFGLYKRHTGQISALFDKLMASVQQTGSAQPADVQAIMLALLESAPMLLAELIVLASGGSSDAESIDDFEKALDIAAHLPLPVQIDALHKIGDLSFTTEMPPGKFFALVTEIASKVTGAIKQNTPET